MLHNANRKRAMCTASGDGEERRREQGWLLPDIKRDGRGESSQANSGLMNRRDLQPLSQSSATPSPSSYFDSSRTSFTTSGSEYTPTPTPASSSSSASFSLSPTTSRPQTPTIFSTALTTSSPSFSTTTSPPSSSSEPPSSSTPPPSSSSGFVFTTFTSSFVTEINGSPTTIVTPIVTALRSSSQSLSSSRAPIIAGSAIAGIALLIVALATLFCLRRRGRRRQRYWALSRTKRLPSRATFLAEETGEEMDLPFPSPPFASLDQSNPFATPSSHRNSSAAGSIGSDGGAPVYHRHSFSRSQSPSSHTHANVSLIAPLPAPSTSLTPPRLLRARASESGSIFHESVWPPPSASSQLMDPLTYPSQSVDLARVVTDVMGPPESGPLLLLQPYPSSVEQGQGQGQEQEQGALNPRGEGEGEGERRGASSTPDNWSPRSELQSSPSSSPPSPPPLPLLPPRPESESELRPPSTPWLSVH